MKMKEFGPHRGARPWRPSLDPPMYYTFIYSNIHNLSEKEPKTPENPIFKTQFETQIQF